MYKSVMLRGNPCEDNSIIRDKNNPCEEEFDNSGQRNIRVMNDLRGERMVMIQWWRQWSS